MIAPDSRLVLLLRLVDHLPMPASERRGRGRPPWYSDRLFLKALVVMLVRHLHRPGELLAVLDEPTPEMRQVRAVLSQGGCLPCRRTWERRLARLPETLPAQIGCLGCLVQQLQPWADCGRAVAIDSTSLHARGGVWHAKHRAAGIVPHTSIDPQAHWTKSGWLRRPQHQRKRLRCVRPRGLLAEGAATRRHNPAVGAAWPRFANQLWGLPGTCPGSVP